jgi:DNA-binding response OmpR family regulator
MKARILLVEDDRPLARVLRHNLTFEGFEVECAEAAAAAIARVRTFAPDLIILDVMLPDQSGFEVFNSLQRKGRTPIIFLTARGEQTDKLRGLRLGADDYITKPFDLKELLARVHNVLRRVQPLAERLVLGPLTVDFRARTAYRGKAIVHLTEREFEMLQYLVEHKDRIVYRSEMLSRLWGYADTPTTRSVDTAIARLRKKIEEDPRHPRYIHTVHGDGYRLTAAKED